ncbi:MAG: hypothetical protein QG673_372 [Pseudomonadota bacterium]|nr:hypothetical protein [Pseudomonadota bacterium]
MRFIVIIYFLCFAGLISGADAIIMDNVFESINVKSNNSESGIIKINNIASNVIESHEKNSGIESGYFTSNPKDSIIIKFDLLFDERLTEDDPRLKSIIYVAASDQNKAIKICYQNDNARALVNSLVKIFKSKGLEKVYFKQTADIHDMKNVWVWLD